jgi:hypothetical protein
MENKVPDEDFVMILITSLPESWDQYTSVYLGCINTSLNDVAYSTRESLEFSRYDWILDSATTSHISNTREALTEYTPLHDATIHGLGSHPITVHASHAFNMFENQHPCSKGLLIQ